MSSLYRTESISSVFRQISQKRKHGVVELIGIGESVVVGFNQGKIVSALQGAVTLEGSVASLLMEEGSLHKDNDAASYASLEAIAAELEKSIGEKSRDVVRTAARKIILDTLFRVKLEGPGHYSFKVQGVEYDASFVQPLTVGQALLDAASYLQAEERFRTVFKEKDRIKATSTDAGGASESEARVLKICSCAQDVDSLSQKILLHALEMKETLLSLKEKGLVEINPKESPKDITPEAPKAEKIEEKIEAAAPNASESSAREKKKKKASLSLPKLPKLSRKKSKQAREDSTEHSADYITLGSVALLVLGTVLPIFLWFNVLSSF